MEVALEAGADDITEEDDGFEILTDPSNFIAVREAMEAAEIPFESASLTMIPNNTVECTGRDAEKVFNLVEALDDHDDVQKVHANFDIPEEELAKIEGA